MASLEDEIDKLIQLVGEPGISRSKFQDLTERIKILRSLIQEK